MYTSKGFVMVFKIAYLYNLSVKTKGRLTVIVCHLHFPLEFIQCLKHKRQDITYKGRKIISLLI